jgi:hypothetical protein
MTALTLRASQILLASPFAVFGRFVTLLMTVVNVIAEAQLNASEATRRFPSAA